MKKEGFELYLSSDIVQGEDIPFYLLWNAVDLYEIDIEISGFSGLSELYNIKERILNNQNKIKISINDLKRDNYLGGSLKTIKTDDPFKRGSLKIKILKKDGTSLELFEERTLYTTCVEIVPLFSDKIVSFASPFLNIQLTGSTTIFLDIKTDDKSDLQLSLPLEIQTSIQKFMESLQSGLDDLKQRFPNNPILELLEDLFRQPEKFTEQSYLEKAGNVMKKYESDEEFKEALGVVFFNAIHVESNMLNLIIRPLMEYFESLAAKKVFLNSPFLTLEILKGQKIFRGKILYQNILEREELQKITYGEIPFEIEVNSAENQIIALKDLISFTRIENDPI